MANDALTGLLSAADFLEAAADALAEGQPAVLVAMDIDGLKPFNETRGHQAGDALILALGLRFAAALEGPGALACRYGGDEFLALLPGRALYDAYEAAEALRLDVQTGVPLDGHEQPAQNTISMGLVDFPANAGDLTDLIEKGKAALLQAKRAGGNAVMFYQERDTLTGLRNAAAAMRALDDALREARSQGQAVSVFVLDIDNFAQINEEYGHRAGDAVLARLGQILEKNFAEAGVVGRTAGDAFVVILPNQLADTAYLLAEEVRRLVEDSQIDLRVGGHAYQLRFHISGGVASFPGDAAERVDLLRRADEALFRAKRSGRNRVALPTASQMVTKTSHFSQTQLERLAELARKESRSEAFLLREALDDLLRKYDRK